MAGISTGLRRGGEELVRAAAAAEAGGDENAGHEELNAALKEKRM